MKPKEMDVVMLDADKALGLLMHYAYDRQRNISRDRVRYYARQMTAGQFLPYSTIEVAWCPDGDGKMHGYLTNGQHRCHAVIEAGVTLPVIVQHVECVDEMEVARRYGLTDIGGSRNINDYIRAAGVGEELGFTRAEATTTAAAAVFIYGGFVAATKWTMSNEERINALRHYRAEAGVYYEMLSGANDIVWKRLTRASTMSVALVTLSESVAVYGDRVAEFWSGAILDDGLRIGDPRKTMLRFLIDQGTPGSSQRAHAARYVANCFNAWTERRTLTFTRVPDHNAPIKINGSRWKG